MILLLDASAGYKEIHSVKIDSFDFYDTIFEGANFGLEEKLVMFD